MLKVGWVLSDGIMGASSRQIGFNINDWFNKNGVDSKIIDQMEGTLNVHKSTRIEVAIQNKEITHLLFQKVCLGKALDYLRLAKEQGITTLYTADDFMGKYGINMELEADIVVTNSNFTKELLCKEFHREIIHIPSAYESDKEFCKKDYRTEQLKVFWFGSLGNASQSLELKDIIVDMGYKYEILSSPPIATIPWTLTYYNDLVQADILVIPCLHPMTMMEKAKGENRPVFAMVLGVPVVVSPFPSYTKLIQQGKTGLICLSNIPEEWKLYLSYLSNQEVRERIGKAGRNRVVDEYNINTVGKQWVNLLKGEYENKRRVKSI